jgi:ComF family protein
MFEQIISLVAPHDCISCRREGSPLCYECRSLLPPPRGTKAFLAANSLQAATSYEGLAKELIHGLKFERSRATARVIAHIMNSRLSVRPGAVLTHIPTATSRVRMRGYDQAALIAQSLARLSGARYVPLLARTGQQRQVGAARHERLSQQRYIYRPINMNLVRDSPIFLIDDVLTTGATMDAATLALRQAHATDVHALVFASA